jgi:HEAT repeat protein
LLTALDAIDDADAALFAEAALYVQLELAKGRSRDSAAGVRARGVLGLARLGHRDLMVLFGACLGDRDATVRVSAARAIAHRGNRDGAGLLLLRLSAGDEVPDVWIECLHGLFALAPEHAMRYMRTALEAGYPHRREQVLHALGTTPHDAAVELLTDQLAAHALADERQAIIEALGLSLRPLARTLLLELVAGDSAADADAALLALAIHRYDTRLVDELRERTADSRERSRRFRELFFAETTT